MHSYGLTARQVVAVMIERLDGTLRDLVVIKSDLRTIKWMFVGIGFGMLYVMPCVASLVLKMYGFL